MKALVVSVLMLASQSDGRAQESPAQVVERQLIAYNAHDPDAFAATYAEDAEIFKSGAAVPVLVGRAAIRASYAGLFRSKPDVRVDVSGRLIAGHFVSDHETVRGTAIKALVVYEVKDGFIRRAWLYSSPPAN